jgi:hypothetical protein
MKRDDLAGILVATAAVILVVLACIGWSLL